MPTTATTARRRRARTQALAADIYHAHRRRLLAIATRNCPTIDDAEEALHDSFAIFIDRFDPDTDAPPLAWLTLTLKRRCWACYRHQQLSRQVTTSDPRRGPAPPRSTEDRASAPALPDEVAEIADAVSQMRRHLAALKPAERKALSLLALGYSYTEIAEITGWTYTKVNRCITEGRRAIRNRQTALNDRPSRQAHAQGAKSATPTLNNP